MLDQHPPGDSGRFNSAAHRPGAALYGREAYPDLDRKTAALLDSIVGNHALLDGNKRLGWLAAVVFYGLNQIELDAPDDPAYELVMSVARRELSIEEIATPLAQWHRSSQRLHGRLPAERHDRVWIAQPTR